MRIRDGFNVMLSFGDSFSLRHPAEPDEQNRSNFCSFDDFYQMNAMGRLDGTIHTARFSTHANRIDLGAHLSGTEVPQAASLDSG